jgi:uncharacterized protein YhjY with autotransporter beta-barrel domain
MFPGNYAVELRSKNSIGLAPSGDGGAPGGVKGRPAGNVPVSGGSSWGSVSGGDEDIGLGILLTDLSSDTTRQGSELENGFDSKLDGYLLGIDYQMFNSFILGATFGSIDDDADIAADGGSFKTESDSQTIYATWEPLENLSLDFYYGKLDSETNTGRNFSFESPSTSFSVEGLITGSYGADQDIQGFSIGYDWYAGAWLIGAFAAFDSVDTKTEAYTEEGDTNFELSYPEQKIKSETESLGLRIGYSVEFGWGVLLPTLQTMSVTENENDARTIPVSLVIAPDGTTPFVAQTDEPDRDYATNTFGVVAAFNNGSQLFLNYEERSGHDFIDTDSVTLGALLAF